MIAAGTIQAMARKDQTSELNVRREYFQHVFLSHLYRQPDSGQAYFKGGSALRLIYRSPRYSEDLDFDTPEGDVKTIETMIAEVLDEIEQEGITTDIHEAKPTSGGYLADLEFSAGETTVTIQLEMSFRKKEQRGEVTQVGSDFLPLYAVTQVRQEDLVAGKLSALLSRGKPRDFYDLYFMLRANLLLPEQRRELPRVIEALHKTKAAFEPELKQFLPRHQWVIIKNLRTALEREIKRFI
ncbi:MAG: nucleotidyl transferase AbiEii/AbiGii toxin family protein [Candidatus Andersenbacteria bacterium]|nr:nucleotidyl transferase AbiEii/AbiGii toxin family protein [Candidatus Andersenbacteria bacterium]